MMLKDLSLDEINLIMSALGKQPYESVYALINKLGQQAKSQMEAAGQVVDVADLQAADFPPEQRAEPEAEAVPSAG